MYICVEGGMSAIMWAFSVDIGLRIVWMLGISIVQYECSVWSHHNTYCSSFTYFTCPATDLQMEDINTVLGTWFVALA